MEERYSGRSVDGHLKGFRLPFREKQNAMEIARVTINRKRCVRCGLCTKLAPAVFHFDAEGNVEAIAGAVPKNQGLILSAISRCPAIALEAQQKE